MIDSHLDGAIRNGPLPGDQFVARADLHVDTHRGAANWFWEARKIDGKIGGINRGYLIVARYHATTGHFDGYGFGWRPALELIEED